MQKSMKTKEKKRNAMKTTPGVVVEVKTKMC